ncbi:hypothetical protein VTH82DRAFT_8460 [Thermothelomyces myriococcoides]
MCQGIIGHCQCLRCLDHPNPGKVQRVEFCEKKKRELVGITSSMTAAECRFYLAPCEDISLVRARDPDACHFKDDKNVAGASENKFTPINDTVSIAKAALSALGENETNRPHGTAADAGDVGGMMVLARAACDASKHEADNVRRASNEMVNLGTTSQHAQSMSNYNDNNMDVDCPPGTAGIGKHTPAEYPLNAEAPANPSSTGTVTPASTSAVTQTGAGTGTSTNTGVGTLPRARPAKTPTSRTPLPTSRPSLPPNRQKGTNMPASSAAAAAAAATTAGSTSRATTAGTTASAAAAEDTEEEEATVPWTHQETIKLLLLRCKQVAFERMVEFLPGRDVTACMSRLAQIAVRHGYEAYI